MKYCYRNDDDEEEEEQYRQPERKKEETRTHLLISIRQTIIKLLKCRCFCPANTVSSFWN